MKMPYSRPAPTLRSASLPMVLLGLAALFSSACGSQDPVLADGPVGGDSEAPVAMQVSEGEIRSVLLLTGKIEAAEGTVMVTPNVGIFPMQIRWVAEDGSEVAAGDRVVEFDNSQLVNRLQDLQSQYQSAATSLSSQRLQDSDAVEEAKITFERRRVEHAKAEIEADIPDNLLSPQEMAQRRLAESKARLELENARQEVDAKVEIAAKNEATNRLKVEDAIRQLQEVRRGIERMNLRAPKDGIVQIGMNRSTGRAMQAGDTVWPGFEAARIPDLETLRVEASLFDVDEGRLEKGNSVEVVLDAFPNERLEGKVASIASIAETPNRSSTRRRFRVLVDVPDFDPQRVRPGMSVRLRLEVEAGVGRRVPRQSLILTDGEPTASLALADGRSVPVVLGPCDTWFCLLEEGPETGTALGSAPSRPPVNGAAETLDGDGDLAESEDRG